MKRITEVVVGIFLVLTALSLYGGIRGNNAYAKLHIAQTKEAVAEAYWWNLHDLEERAAKAGTPTAALSRSVAAAGEVRMKACLDLQALGGICTAGEARADAVRAAERFVDELEKEANR